MKIEDNNVEESSAKNDSGQKQPRSNKTKYVIGGLILLGVVGIGLYSPKKSSTTTETKRTNTKVRPSESSDSSTSSSSTTDATKSASSASSSQPEQQDNTDYQGLIGDFLSAYLNTDSTKGSGDVANAIRPYLTTDALDKMIPESQQKANTKGSFDSKSVMQANPQIVKNSDGTYGVNVTQVTTLAYNNSQTKSTRTYTISVGGGKITNVKLNTSL